MARDDVKPERFMKELKIITAISLGKDRNKDLARVLDTDKSFTSKKVKELEDRGLIHKEGEGRETRYRLNPFNVMQFLQSTVVIKSKKKIMEEENGEEEDEG